MVEINEICQCGGTFRVSSRWAADTVIPHKQFIDAHEDCRPVHGSCMAQLDLPDQRKAFCDLSVHHDGAHESDQGQWYGQVRWTTEQPDQAERVPYKATSRG